MDQEQVVIPQPPKKIIDPQKLLIGSVVLLICLIVGISIGIGLYTGTSSNSTPDESPSSSIEKKAKPANTILFGYWSASESNVAMLRVDTGEMKTLAGLPFNIKHMKMATPRQLLFISDTDERDYGGSISSFDMVTQQTSVIYTPKDGFRIDDFVVSQNAKYISVWEVSVAAGSLTLVGGKSRVVAVDIESGLDNIIYNELALSSEPVHYPIAVTNEGFVYMDTFLPNSGAGWGYGMSKSNFSGSSKVALSSMSNGTYGTQPVPSKDGRRLIFAGYDQKDGPGTQLVGGVRRAVVSPNTLEIFDLESDTRSILVNSQPGQIIASATFDKYSDTPFFNIISKDVEKSGLYTFDINTKDLQMLPPVDDLEYESLLSDQFYLLSQRDPVDSNLGNLSPKYDSFALGLYIVDSSNLERTVLNLGGQAAQVIGVVSNDGVEFDANAAGRDGATKKLQLTTFTIKEKLSEKRQEQQSDDPEPATPRCRDISTLQCNTLLGTSHPATARYKSIPDAEFVSCMQTQWKLNKANRACVDSPLYLYGPEGLNYSVAVGVPIYNTNVDYDPQTGINGKLLSGGQFSIGGDVVDKFAFDYESGFEYTAPKKGSIVQTSKLSQLLDEMGKKLQLTSSELGDLKDDLNGKISSPFVFVSLFDQDMSEKILPLYFSPVPDNYHNLVFYVKGLEKMDGNALHSLDLKPLGRGGFTAVEISYIIAE